MDETVFLIVRLLHILRDALQHSIELPGIDVGVGGRQNFALICQK